MKKPWLRRAYFLFRLSDITHNCFWKELFGSWQMIIDIIKTFTVNTYAARLRPFIEYHKTFHDVSPPIIHVFCFVFLISIKYSHHCWNLLSYCFRWLIWSLFITISNRKSVNKGSNFFKLYCRLLTIHVNRPLLIALSRLKADAAVCQHFHKMRGLQDVDSEKCSSAIVWEIIKASLVFIKDMSGCYLCSKYLHFSVHVLHYALHISELLELVLYNSFCWICADSITVF